MNNAHDTRQAEAWKASNQSTGRNNPSKSSPVGKVQGDHKIDEQESLGRDRATNYGFFVGDGGINEAILTQLLAVAQKGLKKTRAHINWLTEEEKGYLEQIQQLELLIERERKSREQESVPEEE